MHSCKLASATHAWQSCLPLCVGKLALPRLIQRTKTQKQQLSLDFWFQMPYFINSDAKRLVSRFASTDLSWSQAHLLCKHTKLTRDLLEEWEGWDQNSKRKTKSSGDKRTRICIYAQTYTLTYMYVHAHMLHACMNYTHTHTHTHTYVHAYHDCSVEMLGIMSSNDAWYHFSTKQTSMYSGQFSHVITSSWHQKWWILMFSIHMYIYIYLGRTRSSCRFSKNESYVLCPDWAGGVWCHTASFRFHGTCAQLPAAPRNRRWSWARYSCTFTFLLVCSCMHARMGVDVEHGAVCAVVWLDWVCAYIFIWPFYVVWLGVCIHIYMTFLCARIHIVHNHTHTHTCKIDLASEKFCALTDIL